jgi:guanylate kinase
METGIARRGLMLVLSSPSGAGKTTLARRLLDEGRGGIVMSISHTTRPKRKGEKDGEDYHFVDRDIFTRMRDHGEFLEWAVVFDNYYGTTRKPVEQALAEGRDVLFDVDWQGAAALRAAAEHDVVTVFILPPTAADLEQRLNVRAQDPPEIVRRRMLGASNEIQHWQEYDYVVVNYDIEQSVAAVRSILAAERLRGSRLTGLRNFVQNLLAAL